MSELTKYFDPKTSPWLQLHPKLGKDLMEHLWNRLDGLYPGQWQSSFTKNPALMQNWKEAWAEAFDEEGLAPEDIKRGISRISRQCPDFPPNLGQFIRACELIVNYEAAFYEAVAQLQARERGEDTWSHPAIYWAAISIGEFDMRNSSYSGIEVRWEVALKAAYAKKPVSPVPERRTALPSPGKVFISDEQARENCARIKEMLKGFTGKMVVTRWSATDKQNQSEK